MNEKDTYTIIEEFISDYESNAFNKYDVIINDIHSAKGYGNCDKQFDIVTLQDDKNNYLYLVIEKTSGIVVEYAESTSPYLYYNDNKSVDYYLYSPLCYDVKMIDGEIVNAKNHNSITDEAIEFYSKIQQEKSIIESKTYLTQNRTVSAYILNVPNSSIDSPFTDVTISIFNIIKYWANNNVDVTGNGYAGLAPGQDYYVKWVITSYLTLNGGLNKAAVAGAIEDYGDNYGFDSVIDTYNQPNIDFFDLQFEINNDYPCVIYFAAGFTSQYRFATGIGYDTIGTTDYVVVHNWGDAYIQDIKVAFQGVDYICAVTFYDF